MDKVITNKEFKTANKYDGPKINKQNFQKKFCENFLPKGGFIKAKFKSIADGDTAFFEVNGINECVRFMVIDTPKYFDSPEPFGLEAKEYVAEELMNAKEIYLESDPNNNLRDDTLSQRLLAWIWIDGKLLNYMIVRKGLATNKYIISDHMRHLFHLNKAFLKAQKEGLGIHSL